jgi:hypothetical protein
MGLRRIQRATILLALAAAAETVFYLAVIHFPSHHSEGLLTAAGFIWWLWHVPGFLVLRALGLSCAGGIVYFSIGISEFLVILRCIAQMLSALSSKHENLTRRDTE